VSRTWTERQRDEGHDASCQIVVSEGLGFGQCTCNKRLHDMELRKAAGREAAAAAASARAVAALTTARDALDRIFRLEDAALSDAQEIAYETLRAIDGG